MKIVYGSHALDTLTERNIEREWVARTLEEPDSVEPDPVHPDRMRAFRALPERDGRVLRVGICPPSRWRARRDDVPRSRQEEEGVKSRYDAQSDALSLRFTETPIVESEEVRPGIVLDFDAEGRIIALEILDATEHLASGTDLAALTAA